MNTKNDTIPHRKTKKKKKKSGFYTQLCVCGSAPAVLPCSSAPGFYSAAPDSSVLTREGLKPAPLIKGTRNMVLMIPSHGIKGERGKGGKKGKKCGGKKGEKQKKREEKGGKCEEVGEKGKKEGEKGREKGN